MSNLYVLLAENLRFLYKITPLHPESQDLFFVNHAESKGVERSSIVGMGLPRRPHPDLGGD